MLRKRKKIKLNLPLISRELNKTMSHSISWSIRERCFRNPQCHKNRRQQSLLNGVQLQTVHNWNSTRCRFRSSQITSKQITIRRLHLHIAPTLSGLQWWHHIKKETSPGRKAPNKNCLYLWGKISADHRPQIIQSRRQASSLLSITRDSSLWWMMRTKT